MQKHGSRFFVVGVCYICKYDLLHNPLWLWVDKMDSFMTVRDHNSSAVEDVTANKEEDARVTQESTAIH